MKLAAWLALVVLAGCAGNAPSPPPQDAAMLRDTEAAATALSLERPEEAMERYRAALLRARLRDDLPAITDLRFNLAVVALQARHPDIALAEARGLRAELARRAAPAFPALDLVEATALYRLGEAPAADRMATGIEQSGAGPAEFGATFLRGLIADEADDVAGLAEALGRLATVPGTAAEADALELAARLAVRRGAPETAIPAALRAADLRRDLADYRGLSRAVALAAQATGRAGNSVAAADLYLRAGRSAAAQGDTAQARIWLHQAEAGPADVRDTARLQLRLLESPP